MKTIKCPLPKNPYYKNDFNICTEPNSFDPLFMENVNDIADTLAEIMIVCGIHRCKAQASRRVIVIAFQFYDIKRHRYATNECQGSIWRSDIVGDFERYCSMTRIEALLAYCIVKRAIKAFYHDTSDFSVRNPALAAVVLKENEFAWLHAARKTILIFERYEQMFFDSQLNYASQIMKIYKELHERLKRRADPVMLEDNYPRGYKLREVIGTRSPPKRPDELPKCVERCNKTEELRKFNESLPAKELPLKTCLTVPSPCPLKCPKQDETEDSLSDSPPPKRRKEVKNEDLNIPRCYQCNCPKIMCDCKIEPDTGIVAVDCSQGPYQCQWVRVDAGNDEEVTCQRRPEYHQCPVDCASSESSNDSDSTEYCECSAESTKDDDDDDDRSSGEKVSLPPCPDDDEDMEKFMLKEGPKTKQCDIRKISKLPKPKCKNQKEKF